MIEKDLKELIKELIQLIRESYGYETSVVTPSDAEDLAKPAKRLYLGVPGNIKVTLLNGDVRTFTDFQQQDFLYPCVRVHSTGTTATDIIAIH